MAAGYKIWNQQWINTWFFREKDFIQTNPALCDKVFLKLLLITFFVSILLTTQGLIIPVPVQREIC